MNKLQFSDPAYGGPHLPAMWLPQWLLGQYCHPHSVWEPLYKFFPYREDVLRLLKSRIWVTPRESIW